MPIHNLKREINAIEAKTEDLVVQIQDAYQDYLDRLGLTLQRQLIAACYHLCTQLFPDVFLQLKYSDREKLQRSLQSLAEEAKQSLTLMSLGTRILEEPDSETEDLFLGVDAQSEDDFLEELETKATPRTETASVPQTVTAPDLESSDPNGSPNPSDPDQLDPDQLDPDQLDPSQPPSLRNPQVLVDWYSELEQAIGDVLRTVSQKATQILEKAGIIHNQLPSPLLEIATQSEAAENVGSDHPNILNLVVEMGKISEEGRKSSTQRIEIIAIYLRLSDLEFTDTYLVSHRNKLRSQFQQLKSLSKIYHKRSREYSIAQAEAAWRSSWVEE